MDVRYPRPIVKNPVLFPLMDDGNPNCQELERETFLIVDEPPESDEPPGGEANP